MSSAKCVIFYQKSILLALRPKIQSIFEQSVNDTTKFKRNLLRVEIYFDNLNLITITETAAYTVTMCDSDKSYSYIIPEYWNEVFVMFFTNFNFIDHHYISRISTDKHGIIRWCVLQLTAGRSADQFVGIPRCMGRRGLYDICWSFRSLHGLFGAHVVLHFLQKQGKDWQKKMNLNFIYCTKLS